MKKRQIRFELPKRELKIAKPRIAVYVPGETQIFLKTNGAGTEADYSNMLKDGDIDRFRDLTENLVRWGSGVYLTGSVPANFLDEWGDNDSYKDIDLLAVTRHPANYDSAKSELVQLLRKVASQEPVDGRREVVQIGHFGYIVQEDMTKIYFSLDEPVLRMFRLTPVPDLAEVRDGTKLAPYDLAFISQNDFENHVDMVQKVMEQIRREKGRKRRRRK